MNNFIKGLLFGATVGGAGGLLFAPKSGKETQKQLQGSLDDVTESVQEFNQSLEHFQAAVVQTQQVIEETIPAVKTSLAKDIEAFKFQAQPRLERVNEQLAQLQEHFPEKSNQSD